MPEKNPYENQNTNEIPSFVSVFETDDIKLPPLEEIADAKIEETVEETVEEEETEAIEKRPLKTNKRRLNLFNISLLIIIALLLINLVLLIVTIKKSSELKKLQNEHETYVTNTNKEIEQYKTLIAEAEQKKKEESSVEKKQYRLLYAMKVRKNASTSAELASPADLPANLADRLSETSSLPDGTLIEVLETKNNGTQTWGKIADQAWILLNDSENDGPYAKAE